jgi:hypothetical protein
MNELGPYSLDELREMRRLILASGGDIAVWCTRLHRSADFLSSLSPSQAGIIAEQAAAIAAEPEDYGDDEMLVTARATLALIPPEQRAEAVWRQIVAFRRRHYDEE